MPADANLQPNISSRKQRELGTIEVVVLRCNYEGLTSTPQATHSAHARAASVRSAVRAQPAARQAPAKKPPTPEPSDAGLGGMFGLFDGACDINLDGTAPYPALHEQYGPRKRFAYEDEDDAHEFGARRGRIDYDMPANPYRRADRGPGYNNDLPSRPMNSYARPPPSPHVQFRDDAHAAPPAARYGTGPHGAPAYNSAPYNAYPYGGASAQRPAGPAYPERRPDPGEEHERIQRFMDQRIAAHEAQAPQIQLAYAQPQPYGPVWVPVPAGQNPVPVQQGGYDFQQDLWRAQEQLRQLKAFNESQAQHLQQSQPQGPPHFQPSMPMPTTSGPSAPQQAGNPIDPETQRGTIWRLGQQFWENMGYDGRILAAAVPYIAMLRNNLVIDLNDIQRAEVTLSSSVSLDADADLCDR